MGGLREGATYDERLKRRAELEAVRFQVDEQSLLMAFRQEPADAGTLRFQYDRFLLMCQSARDIADLELLPVPSTMSPAAADDIFGRLRTWRFKHRLKEMIEISASLQSEEDDETLAYPFE